MRDEFTPEDAEGAEGGESFEFPVSSLELWKGAIWSAEAARVSSVTSRDVEVGLPEVVPPVLEGAASFWLEVSP